MIVHHSIEHHYVAGMTVSFWIGNRLSDWHSPIIYLRESAGEKSDAKLPAQFL